MYFTCAACRQRCLMISSFWSRGFATWFASRESTIARMVMSRSHTTDDDRRRQCGQRERRENSRRQVQVDEPIPERKTNAPAASAALWRTARDWWTVTPTSLKEMPADYGNDGRVRGTVRRPGRKT